MASEAVVVVVVVLVVTRCTISPELCWPGFDAKIKSGTSRSVYCQISGFLRALVCEKMPKNGIEIFENFANLKRLFTPRIELVLA